MGQLNEGQAPSVCLLLGSFLLTEHPACSQSQHLGPSGLRDATDLHKDSQVCPYLCTLLPTGPSPGQPGFSGKGGRWGAVE